MVGCYIAYVTSMLHRGPPCIGVLLTLMSHCSPQQCHLLLAGLPITCHSSCVLFPNSSGALSSRSIMSIISGVTWGFSMRKPSRPRTSLSLAHADVRGSFLIRYIRVFVMASPTRSSSLDITGFFLPHVVL